MKSAIERPATKLVTRERGKEIHHVTWSCRHNHRILQDTGPQCDMTDKRNYV